jgi:CDP-paratose 2-epimerase
VSVAIITGSAGLVGSVAARHFVDLGLHVVGIDNDLRRRFFGADGATGPNADRLARELDGAYTHHTTDVRDRDALERIFARYGRDLSLVIHAAAQPSHDWAVRDPFTDFDINASATLNVLEFTRRHSPAAAVIFCSSNKVYGDHPNRLPLIEEDTRFEISPAHRYTGGIAEDMPIDACLHSIFGVGKAAADLAVQEYGRYFGMNTATFRCGTLTGPAHAAAELHGFLAYLVRCAMEHRTYTIYGYGGKQVRDAIHADDVVTAFEAYWRAPRPAQVYNLGGGRAANVSLLEAITQVERITGETLVTRYEPVNRVGDHKWWIGSNRRFERHYPQWRLTRDVSDMLTDMYTANLERWRWIGAGA